MSLDATTASILLKTSIHWQLSLPRCDADQHCFVLKLRMRMKLPTPASTEVPGVGLRELGPEQEDRLLHELRP